MTAPETNMLCPAAQYLRMSTEHQQYSLENQSTAVRKYAELNGLKIIQTYSDAAKSGLVIKRRPGLRQLLQDVMAGTAAYRAILVYDVSRWGRFQDIDESAHYEFLCRSAGVPVHYCAETFANDGSLPSLMMKALKRTMAGEYSRELGVKVLAGQKRLARLGFKQGGVAGYGLRRMLVSSTGTFKQALAAGERKSIATDRVILVPGPAPEVQVVRDIFRMLVTEKRSVYAISRELNCRSVSYGSDSGWDYHAVFAIVTSPKYAGCHVFGRTSSKLSTPSVKVPSSEWILTPGAFEQIVDSQTFSEAQRILKERTVNKSNKALLDYLRDLLASKGRLSVGLIKGTPGIPSPSTYRHRFGSLRRAYELIGYGHHGQFGPIDIRRRTQGLREDVIAQITSMFPDEVSIIRRGGRWRSRLQLRNGLMISVLIGRAVHPWKHTVRWQIDPVSHECAFITLLVRLDERNLGVLDLHIIPSVNRRNRFVIVNADPWLNRGQRLHNIEAFPQVVAHMVAMRSEIT